MYLLFKYIFLSLDETCYSIIYHSSKTKIQNLLTVERYVIIDESII